MELLGKLASREERRGARSGYILSGGHYGDTRICNLGDELAGTPRAKRASHEKSSLCLP